jgi:hypothetical protein
MRGFRNTRLGALAAVVLAGVLSGGMLVAVAGVSVGGMARPAAATTPAGVIQNCPNGSPPQFSGFAGGTGAFHSDHFLSDYVTAPPFGANDIPNGDFTNILLFPPGFSSWDAYVASLPPAMQPPTQEQIDAMTLGLVCSSFFDLLTQYNLNTPVYAGDQVTASDCVTTALNDAASTKGVISYATMRSFAACNSNANNDPSPQVNIFVGPTIAASAYNEDGTNLCSAKLGGYHGAGVGVPQWTTIATLPSCNTGPGGVMEVESHEMVELISDNFGLGWVHGVLPDFNETYDNGELEDICSGVGVTPTPSIPFPNITMPNGTLTGLQTGSYWSDQDNRCEPGAIMNDTPVPLAGSPSVTFSSTVHSLTVPINDSNANTIKALELDVATGTSGLGGGNSLNVTLTVNLGGSMRSFTTNGLNEGTLWGNGTMHAVLLPFVDGISPSNLVSMTLSTDSTSWNVTGVQLQASVVTPPAGCTPLPPVLGVNANGTATLSDGSKGLVRLIGGSTQTFTETFHAPAAVANRQVAGLSLVIGTGGDDLGGGNEPSDNANAIIMLKSGQQIAFDNINDNANWTNGFTSQPIDLADSSPLPNVIPLNVLPPDTTFSQITSFSLQTNFPGGLSGQNWDVKSISLTAAVGCPATSPPPTFVSTTLVNVANTTTLGDGSTGLCRETGGSNDCPVSIPSVSPSLASDTVTALQVTLTTGSDNLRGGGEQGDNAQVILHFGGSQTYQDVNNSDTLDNGSIFSFPLVPPPSTTLGALTSIDIHTQFGSLFPDNWDIAGVRLDAIADPPGTPTAAHALAAPAPPAPVDPAAGAPTGGTALSPNQVPDPAAVPATSAPNPAIATPPSWFVTSTPNQGSGGNQLLATSCADPTDCVSVGDAASTGGVTPVAEVLQSGSWTVTPTAFLGDAIGILYGVSCSSPTACMAVGVQVLSAQGPADQPLIETWNGTTWSLVTTPPPGPGDSLLSGVSCPAANDCVAVGHVFVDGTSQALVESWNGSAWVIVPSPDPSFGNTMLFGVSCPSKIACTAVGTNDATGPDQTLVETFAGGPWAIQPSADQGTTANVLQSVSCSSAAACTAVGDFVNNIGKSNQAHNTLIERWNGSSWTVVPSTDPAAAGDSLDSVSCPDAHHCVAAGSSFDGSTHTDLVESWSGGAWSTTAVPSPGSTTSVLSGVSCPTYVNCQAAGFDDNASGTLQTLDLDHHIPVPTMSQLTFTLSPSLQLTLSGSGFSPKPPAQGTHCGHTGSDFVDSNFTFSDVTGGWGAGAPADCIGLVVSKYQNTAITFGFGNGYGGTSVLQPGDTVEIVLYGGVCLATVPTASTTETCTIA